MANTETDTYHLLGNLLRFLVRPGETETSYCLVESTSAPGAGAPPNRHPDDEEAFYVIDGSFEFMIDGRTTVAGPGFFVQIPNGAVHAFTNVGEKPGRMLIINAPGRSHLGFFSEAGEALPAGTRELPPPAGAPDIPRLLEIGRRNGLEFLLPKEQAGAA